MKVIHTLRQYWYERNEKNKSDVVEYVLWGLGSVLGFGFVWSLLFRVFNKSPVIPLPWEAFSLAFSYTENTVKTNALLLISFCVPASLTGWMMSGFYQQKRLKEMHGDAHWASMREIKKMGLLDCRFGLIIGKKQGYLLRAPLISHALVFAPSRSGKGVSQVIPNALTFNDSLLVIDIKDEIFEATSGFRQKHGQTVYSFAPLRENRKTHRWNPLDMIDPDAASLIGDIDLIVETLIRYTDDVEKDVWNPEARALLKGLLLWLMDSGLPFNFGYLTNFIKGTPDFTKALKNIRDEAINEDGTININQTAFININNFINKAEKERSGVKTTLTSKLNLWDDPLVQAATETSDFDMRHMRAQKTTIYLGIPVNQLTRLSPLMNAFIQLFLNAMTKSLPTQAEPYKVLAILDEFCALGHMQKLKEGFGYLAGFNVHLMAIIQNVGQFYGLYGGRDSSDAFFQNTDYKIIYRQNTKTDREFVSDLCGVRMVKNRTESFKQEMLGEKPTSSSQSFGSKPLISADQVGKLAQQYGIAKFNGEQAVKYERIIYYKDPLFKDRILPFIDLPEITFAYVPFKVKKPEQSEQSEKSEKPEKRAELPTLNLPDLSKEESKKNKDEHENAIENDFDIE